MRHAISSILLAIGLLLAGLPAAIGQDWNGRWVTEGAAVTNYLDLTQTGTALQGTVSGHDTGTLTGTTNGGALTATLKLGNGVTYTVTGSLQADVIQLTLTAGPSATNVRLVRDTQQAQQTDQQQQQQPPAGAQYYYLDAANAQFGPFDIAGVQTAVTAGTIKPETLMWTAGMAGWERADAVAAVAPLFVTPPDPPPGEADYWLQDANYQNLGPFTFGQVRVKITDGEVKPWSMVWISTTQDWDRADGYDEFVPYLFPATPPAPTAATVSLPAFTPNLTPDERKKIGTALGATIGVLFHELGHAMIGEMQVPVTGPEEDSVDEFAAIMMSSAFHPDALKDESPEIQTLLLTMVQNAAMIWRRSEEDKARNGLTHPWYDSHSSDSNRFRNMLCIIYGSAPATYTALADHVAFPQDQRDRCEFDYKRRQNAWTSITAPFIRDIDGTGEGKAPADAPGGEVVLEYRPSLTATGANLTPVFRDSGIFENLAELMEKYFVWPKRLQITFADCGEFNAFYHETYSEVTMCWEGVEGFAGLVLDGERIPRR